MNNLFHVGDKVVVVDKESVENCIIETGFASDEAGELLRRVAEGVFTVHGIDPHDDTFLYDVTPQDGTWPYEAIVFFERELELYKPKAITSKEDIEALYG